MAISPCSARIQGDDYQHLFAWYQALRLLRPDRDVERVEVESLGAGNVDDVVVRGRGCPDEYVQVKFSVDARRPISSHWFTDPIKLGGRTPLQRFHESWVQLRAAGPEPRLTLFTNRALDPADPVLGLRRGRDAVLGPRLAEQASGSAAGRGRAAWAAHLSVSEVELIEFLTHLSLRTDQGSWSGLVEAAGDRMRSVGLRGRDTDVETGVAAIRSWVSQGVRTIERDALDDEVRRRGLHDGPQYSTLLVEAIDHAPWFEAARHRLDWVALFEGEEARARTQLKDPSLWSTRLRPEMVAAAAALKSEGAARVLVRGAMRLPLWFLAGVELPDVRGHHVACVQRGAWWTSDTTARPFEVTVTSTPLGFGRALAVGISVTNRIGDDVMEHCTRSSLPVSYYVDIAPAAGSGGDALPDGASALGWARATRDAIRAAVRIHRPSQIHLFLSGPAGGALLLGHAWNRVGPTLVYEHLGAGYAPTFTIP